MVKIIVDGNQNLITTDHTYSYNKKNKNCISSIQITNNCAIRISAHVFVTSYQQPQI